MWLYKKGTIIIEKQIFSSFNLVKHTNQHIWWVVYILKCSFLVFWGPGTYPRRQWVKGRYTPWTGHQSIAGSIHHSLKKSKFTGLLSMTSLQTSNQVFSLRLPKMSKLVMLHTGNVTASGLCLSLSCIPNFVILSHAPAQAISPYPSSQHMLFSVCMSQRAESHFMNTNKRLQFLATYTCVYSRQ